MATTATTVALSPSTTTAPTPTANVIWDFGSFTKMPELIIQVGDQIRFTYGTTSIHDVTEEDAQQFDKCELAGVNAPASGFGVRGNGGSDAVEVSPVFAEAGTRYFVCAVSGHCSAGMKLKVKVVGKTTPTPTAITSTPIATTPSVASTSTVLGKTTPSTNAPSATTPSTNVAITSDSVSTTAQQLVSALIVFVL